MTAIDPASAGHVMGQLADIARSLPVRPRVPLAYMDPGTGSLLLQALLAALLTVPFLIRSRIAAAIRWLGRKVRRGQPPDDTTPQA